MEEGEGLGTRLYLQRFLGWLSNLNCACAWNACTTARVSCDCDRYPRHLPGCDLCEKRLSLCDQIVTPVAGGCTALACTWKVEEEEEVAYGSPTSATGLNHRAEAYTKSGSCLFSYWACKSRYEYF